MSHRIASHRPRPNRKQRFARIAELRRVRTDLLGYLSVFDHPGLSLELDRVEDALAQMRKRL